MRPNQNEKGFVGDFIRTLTGRLVGKSSLVQRFVHNTFNIANDAGFPAYGRGRRDDGRVEISEVEAEAVYKRATARATQEVFDLTIDTSQPLDEIGVVQAVQGVLSSQPA